MKNNDDMNLETIYNDTCPVLGHQDVSICLPVEVKPFAETGKIKTECVGKPTVISCSKCKPSKETVCYFTINQKIRVEVPVIFGAETKVDDPHIDCGCKKSDITCVEDDIPY